MLLKAIGQDEKIWGESWRNRTTFSPDPLVIPSFQG